MQADQESTGEGPSAGGGPPADEESATDDPSTGGSSADDRPTSDAPTDGEPAGPDAGTTPVLVGSGVALLGALLVAAAVAVALVDAPNDGVLFFMPYVVAAVGLFVLVGGGVAVGSRLR